MKLKIIFIAQLVSIATVAQTAEDRLIIRKSSDQNSLHALKQKNEVTRYCISWMTIYR
ncbi:hypothetical protein SD427_10080 [Chryseobacterium sp. JJR-5R]|uniref:hypothetical protein n=1 Tax=Chryseobacterium sp. JJR-5R TaxID=3093923 RepID=UPI002A74D079|nr:hypothetical protein [Chryseobacterium sp. JJR-5R]WPO81108.1 hypothetical protein SD427_10080 [Chryseobacterium sp. JJR-5R]